MRVDGEPDVGVEGIPMCAFKLPIVCATDVDARVAIDLGLARGPWLVVRREPRT